MLDASWNRDGQPLIVELVALTRTRDARVAPHLAAPTTFGARMEEANIQGHHDAQARLLRRDRDFGVGRTVRSIRIDVIATEKLDGRRRRRKIDGDFIDKRSPERTRVRGKRFEREGRAVSTRS